MFRNCKGRAHNDQGLVLSFALLRAPLWKQNRNIFPSALPIHHLQQNDSVYSGADGQETRQHRHQPGNDRRPDRSEAKRCVAKHGKARFIWREERDHLPLPLFRHRIAATRISLATRSWFVIFDATRSVSESRPVHVTISVV